MKNPKLNQTPKRRSCHRLVRALAISAATLVTSAVSYAQLVINVGNYNLLPNTPNQEIILTVQNPTLTDVDVEGLTFNLQIDQGTGSGGPAITFADVRTGTVFANENPQTSGLGNSQLVNRGVTTVSGTVPLPASSSTTLATVRVDTTGFFNSQTWDFNVGDTVNGTTVYFRTVNGDLVNIVPNITDGTISVVPEPNATLVVAGVLGAFAGFMRWRRARA